MYWIEFFLSGALIVGAGVHLTKYADKLSDRLNLGKAFVGILLLGFITSLPEAITCIASIIRVQANDLAVGNLLGSNNFNPLLIVIVDLFYRRGSITNAIIPHRSQWFSACFVILMTAVVLIEMASPYGFKFFGLSLLKIGQWGHVSVGGFFVTAIYFAGMYYLGVLNRNTQGIEIERPPENHEDSLSKIYFHLVLSTVVIVGAAIWLAQSADTIAIQTGLGRTFVGSILLALMTSLPEMVVTISAVRLGAFDLAIGNIFGSNMTNLFILVLCGLFFTPAPILQTVSPTHGITALMSCIMILIALKGIGSNSKKVIGWIGIDSILLFITFMIGTFILYQLR